MPIIKPISDLRNNFNEISDIVHKDKEPVFITKNGQGDMVVMSIESYDLMQKKLELFSKLSISQAQRAAGDKGRLLSHVVEDIRKKI
jgi:prevent-host-death family protein